MGKSTGGRKPDDITFIVAIIQLINPEPLCFKKMSHYSEKWHEMVGVQKRPSR